MENQEFRRLTTRETFEDWLRQVAPWTTKADMTYSWNCNEFDAKKKFEKWMRKHLPSSNYIYAVERDPYQDKVAPTSNGINQACHIHAITDTNWPRLKKAGVSRKQIWNEWFSRYGRAKIEPARNIKDAVGYCMKKVMGYSEAREVPDRVCRRGQVDWNLVFGLGKRGRVARERCKKIEVAEWSYEL